MLGVIAHGDDLVHQGVQVAAGMQKNGPARAVHGVHNALMPGKHIFAHHGRAQEGLGVEAPVVIGGNQADGLMLQGQLVIAHQAAADRVKNAPGQLRLVIQHQAEVLIANQFNHILQHAPRPHHHQFHALRQIAFYLVQKVGRTGVRIRPGEGFKAAFIPDARVGVEGAGVLGLKAAREMKGGGVQCGIIIAHFVKGAHRETGDAQGRIIPQPLPVDALIQRHVHEQLKQHRARGRLFAQHGQQKIEIRLMGLHMFSSAFFMLVFPAMLPKACKAVR